MRPLVRETGAELVARIRETFGIEVEEPPNFRDYGMTAEWEFKRIVGNLQRRDGVAACAESFIRLAILQDLGHLAGKDTIKEMIDRLELQGELGYDWLAKGQKMPNGAPVRHGVRLLWLMPAHSRDYKRAQAAMLRRQKGERRMPVHNRVDYREALSHVRSAFRRVRRAPLTDAEAQAMAADDQEARQLVADLMAKWSRESEARARGRPPPSLGLVGE